MVGKAVDLGLPSGTKWADCNVGAASPEDFGDYFAWGETSPKDEYTEGNSEVFGMDYSTLKSKGITDSDGNLTAKYDAATANWGKSWHMPTLTQIEELLDECEWTWTTKNGVNGFIVTGANGNSIFLPAAGDRIGTSLDLAGSIGEYWSSTAYEEDSSYAYDLFFIICDNNYCWDTYYHRYYGHSVRPVSE